MQATKDLCVRSIQMMADGTLDQLEDVVHSEAYNRESKDEPPATRGRGAEAFYATALWLRDAFDELAFEIHDVVTEGDLVVIHNTMSGRHTGVFTIYGPNGEITQGHPANRQAVRHDPDALDARQGLQGDRTLGQPRRPGHSDATRLDSAVSVKSFSGLNHSDSLPPRWPARRWPSSGSCFWPDDGRRAFIGVTGAEAHRNFASSVSAGSERRIGADPACDAYWFSVSDDEQERRFQARMADPTKNWKLSPMDLESRARWVDYSRAKDDMFRHTDTKQSPWWVVHADDKVTARLNCIHHLLSVIPYDEASRPQLEMPQRQDDTGYVRPPVEDQTFVPSVY